MTSKKPNKTGPIRRHRFFLGRLWTTLAGSFSAVALAKVDESLRPSHIRLFAAAAVPRACCSSPRSSRRYVLLATAPLMIEYGAVLTRVGAPERIRVVVGRVEAILDAIAIVAGPVRLAYVWRPTLRDPSDDTVLETAVNGRADILVTVRTLTQRLRSFSHATFDGLFEFRQKLRTRVAQ